MSLRLTQASDKPIKEGALSIKEFLDGKPTLSDEELDRIVVEQKKAQAAGNREQGR